MFTSTRIHKEKQLSSFLLYFNRKRLKPWIYERPIRFQNSGYRRFGRRVQGGCSQPAGFKGRENVAFLVVLHSYLEGPPTVAEHMGRLIEMPAAYAENGMEPKGGQVLIARPDLHLLIKDGKLRFSNGPKENLFRPSIDVLFRSSAVEYGNRVIGLLLSGRLNDGTLGLSAIKRCGGITIVQDPATAEYADMPLLAQTTVDPDYVLKLEDMTRLLERLLDNPLPPEKEVPDVLRKEVQITRNMGSLLNEGQRDLEEEPYSCPSCGGPLKVMEDETTRHFRCRTGHSFTMESLDEGQGRQLEETLWVALRVLDERLALLRKMIRDYERKGLDMLAKANQHKLKEVEQHSIHLKKLIGLHE